MTGCCVVVIGHVDHGKTALVKALTGQDTDRLPEEKLRGLSIQPGFAHCSYPTGMVDFIDAPGHADFIQAMITGAAGAAAALVVVSGLEGICTQTVEHLNIAESLGIRAGVVAVTKSDLLSASEQATCLSNIANEMSQTSLTHAKIVMCSAHNGVGIDDLHAAIRALLPDVAPTSVPLHSFLPIDRVFSLPGHGTIVTGTLLGHDMSVDAHAVLQPLGREVTLRSLQSRGAARECVKAGERIAANLRGISVADIARGAVLCTPQLGGPSSCIDVHLNLLASAEKPLTHMQEVRVAFGTTSEVAQVRLFDGRRLAPDKSGFAQLRFRNTIMGFAGQRAVLRTLSPAQTIGGAVILDPQAVTTRSGDKGRLRVLEAAKTGDLFAIAHGCCAANGGVASLCQVARLGRILLDDVMPMLAQGFMKLETDVLASKNMIESCKVDLRRALTAYHAQNPLKATAPRHELLLTRIAPALLTQAETDLSKEGHLRIHPTSLTATDHDPLRLLSTDQRHRMNEILRNVRNPDLPPMTLESLNLETIDQDLIALLIDTGALLALRNVALKQTLLFHPAALTDATALLRAHFPIPQRFTTSQARTALATSRRTVVPVLEYLDAQGITFRDGDTRQMTAPNMVPHRCGS